LDIIHHILPYIKYYFTAATKYDVHSPFLFNFITEVVEDKKHYEAYDTLEKLFSELDNNNTILEIEDLGAGSTYGMSTKKSVAQVFNNTAFKGKYGKLLFRIINYYKPSEILELGTGFGIATSYMALANTQASITTIEGSATIAKVTKCVFASLDLNNISLIEGDFDLTLPAFIEQHKSIDLALIDGNHRYESTVKYFQQLLPLCHNNTIIIFDDIRWSAEMLQAWHDISEHTSVSLSLDLYKIGIIFFRKEFKVKQHFAIRF
jgi:predicted O-methyltransferase YrrM